MPEIKIYYYHKVSTLLPQIRETLRFFLTFLKNVNTAIIKNAYGKIGNIVHKQVNNRQEKHSNPENRTTIGNL